MRLRWTAPAAQDLYSITHFIRRDKPTAAREVAKSIYERCESLRYSPLRGRKGKRAGTRELVLSPLPYIVVYRVTADIVEILHIWHRAQDK
jgi:toxin ParE1/3/4